MSVLIDHHGLERRRRAAAGPLKPLAESLASDLEPLLSRELYFPSEKALLSRAGGRCEVDGTMLEFDPFSRHEHRCPRCGRVYTGELHERFWNYWYQLWLAERAVHGAALSSVGFGDRYATLAHDILAGYCDRYLRYPNVDNVLGPTRLFFSTYLESIWLLQICVAADLMETRESAPGRSRARGDRRTQPLAHRRVRRGRRRIARSGTRSRFSPRLGSWATPVSAERAALGRSGVARQIAHGILSDGTWYEGENYHLFAHRGLWYGVTMAEHAGIEIEPALVAAIPARILRAVPVGASGFHTSVPTRLPIRDLAATMANRRALRAWPRARGRSDAARRARPHVPRRCTARNSTSRSIRCRRGAKLTGVRADARRFELARAVVRAAGASVASNTNGTK